MLYSKYIRDYILCPFKFGGVEMKTRKDQSGAEIRLREWMFGRTHNRAEAEVARELIDEGYKVFSRGWPDFLAIRGDEVRLIEVKPRPYYKLSWYQAQVAEALAKKGLMVEKKSPKGALERKPLPRRSNEKYKLGG